MCKKKQKKDLMPLYLFVSFSLYIFFFGDSVPLFLVLDFITFFVGDVEPIFKRTTMYHFFDSE